jgi:hypothetical protein
MLINQEILLSLSQWSSFGRTCLEGTIPYLEFSIEIQSTLTFKNLLNKREVVTTLFHVAFGGKNIQRKSAQPKQIQYKATKNWVGKFQ